MRRILYGDLETAGACHVARSTYRLGDRLGLHTHDYFELFWLESGRCDHVINGRREALSPGQVVFVRAKDVHGWSCREAFTLVNMALPAAAGRTIEKRYGASYWDARPRLPRVVEVPGRAGLEALGKAADRLALDVGPARRRDAFLLELFDVLEPPTAQQYEVEAPAWLREAMQTFEGEDLREGMSALVGRSHRSREHVGRSLRKHYGVSLSEWVNARRLERSAYLLRMSDLSILEIALEVGFENLGYFYRLFQRRYAVTPRQFKVRERAVMGGNEKLKVTR